MTTPKENGLAEDTLTEREREIMSKAWRCLKTAPEIDFTKLAAECNMTNIGSASNAWSKIKKKMFSDLPSAGASTGSTVNRKRKQVTKYEKKTITATINDSVADSTTTKRATAVAAFTSAALRTDKAPTDNVAGQPSKNVPFTNAAFFTPINLVPKRRRRGAAGDTTRVLRTSKEVKIPGPGRDKNAIKEEEYTHETSEVGYEDDTSDNKMEGNGVDDDGGI